MRKHYIGNLVHDCDSSSFLNLKDLAETGFNFGEKNVGQIKVAVKQGFDTVDAIIFEAALTLNGIETKHKQKEYVS